MGDVLRKRLRQTTFESPYQEAILSVLVAANSLNEHIDKACDEYGISRQQYNILRILRGSQGSGYQCGDIACRMLDRAPDITRRIDNLEKLGLVERSRSDEDRRVVITTITPRGLELLENLVPHLKEFENLMATRLTKQDCKTLVELCERLIAVDES